MSDILVKEKNLKIGVFDDDSKDRQEIINNISQNFFVEAGAGSGKTSCLVDRMVSMVKNGIDIKKICAITFTKAAANEFYERFRDELSKDIKCELAQKALKDIDLCFMGTIDSFCNMIISEHPLAAKLPSNTRVINDAELKSIAQTYFSYAKQGFLGSVMQNKYFNAENNLYYVQDYLTNAIIFLLKNRNTKLVYDIPTKDFSEYDNDINEYFKKEQNEIRKLVKWINAHDQYLNANVSKRPSSADLDVLKLLEESSKVIFDDWSNIQDIVYFLMKFQKIRLSLDVTQDDDFDEIKHMFFELFNEAGSRPPLFVMANSKNDLPYNFPILEKLKNFQLFLILDFLKPLSKIILDDLKEQGLLTYTDYIYYLKETLYEDAKCSGQLIEYLSKNHSYFLIDEFQDTAPIQSQIFFYLAANKKEGGLHNDWKKCIPRPGSLFIVGDPKQSIYRFRGADVDSYLKVKNLFKNKVGKVLNLTQNFRSSAKMCLDFNTLFSRIFDDPSSGCDYKEIPIPQLKKENYSGGSLSGVYDYKYKYNWKLDYVNVSNIIKSIVQNPAVTIQPAPNKNGIKKDLCQINYKDIMVIVQNKAHLKAYMNAFRYNDIPFWVEGNVMFDSCPSLNAVVALMKFVYNPINLTAKFLVEKVALCKPPKELDNDINALSFYSPSALFVYLLDAFDILKRIGTKNIEYLYYAQELLKLQESQGIVCDLLEAIEYLESLMSNNQDQERCLQFEKSSNRVLLANLHKVKGLERPVVFLGDPLAKKRMPPVETYIDYSKDTPTSYLFADRLSNFSFIDSTSFSDLQEIEKVNLDKEKLRLMYVGATRAGCALFISNPRSGYKVGDIGKPSSTCQWIPLLNDENILKEIPQNLPSDLDGNAILTKELDTGKLESQKKLLKNNNNIITEFNKIDTFLSDELHQSTYKIVLPSKEELEFVELSQDDDRKTFVSKHIKKKNAVFIGTIIHKLMELLVNARMFDPIKKAFKLYIDQVAFEYNIEDKSYLEVLEYAPTCTDVIDLFKDLKDASDIFTEFPFTYSLEENEQVVICDGIIDLLYCKDGSWYIVDYKTNTDGTANELKNKYINQLAKYIQALEICAGVKAEAKICHIPV